MNGGKDEAKRSRFRDQPPRSSLHRSSASRTGTAPHHVCTAQNADSQLASWNEGAAKQAIIDFVRATTDQASPKFVPPEERITTFDQDGTLWVEQIGRAHV